MKRIVALVSIIICVYCEEQICEKQVNCLTCMSANKNCLWSPTNLKCTISSNSIQSDKWYSSYSICMEDKETIELASKYCLHKENKGGKIFPYHPYLSDEVTNQNYVFCRWKVDLYRNTKKTIDINFEEKKHSNNKYAIIFNYDNKEDEEAYLELSGESAKYVYNKKKKNIIGFTFLFFGANITSSDLFIFSAKESKALSIGYIILIIILVLLVIFIFGCFFYKFKAMEENKPADSREVIITHNTNAIDQIIKPIEYKSGPEPIQCTICVEKINDNNEVAQLDCGHYFHSECLKTWLNKQKKVMKCPNCNFVVANFKQGFIIINKVQPHNRVVSEENQISNEIIIHTGKILTSSPSRNILVTSDMDNNENNNNILTISNSS